MIARLVWRSFRRRPGRSALLLAGYALGVAVTVALLSIGGALLAQSRDRALVGGGDLTVLPAGLDLETFRTGGASSLHFTLGQADFLYRQVLTGERFRGTVRAAAPWLDDELLYVRIDGELLPASAGGEIPSRAAALDAAPRVLAGEWRDAGADRRWMSPGDSALYAEIDAFHARPPEAAGDSSWAEWHYFNVVLPDDEGWLYLTYLVGGPSPEAPGGGLLATWVGPRGPRGERAERVWSLRLPPEEVRFSTDRPDLALADAEVRLDARGRYRLRAEIPAAAGAAAGGPVGGAAGGAARDADGDAGAESLRVELVVTAEGRRYLPPLEVAGGAFPSGYVAPVLRGRAAGRLCAGGRCLEVEDAPAYHDHNWGVWRDVTWDWGTARLEALDLLYGGVRSGGEAAGGRFLFLTDGLGFAGLLPVTEVRYRYAAAPGTATSSGARPAGPRGLVLEARRGGDSLLLRVEVDHVRATLPGESAGGDGPGAGSGGLFFQMRGRARLEGRLGGEPVDARGEGFFETWSEPEGEGRRR